MVVGKCTAMCPSNEITQRESGRRLHVLEMVARCNRKQPRADREKCVKEYVRSAAGGRNKLNPHTLRTPQALLDTTQYLLESVLDVSTHRYSLHVATTFISDRLRCVRQDIIVQQLPWQQAAVILERIVRYHVFIQQANRNEREFDSILNEVFLNSYLSDLFEYYHSADLEGATLPNRDEFVSYYLLLNLENSENTRKCLFDNLHFHTLRSTSKLYAVQRIVKAYSERNFYRVLKLARTELSFLQAACLQKTFNRLRMKLLDRLNVAYSSKNFKFPTSKLSEWLVLDDFANTQTLLTLCDFKFAEEKVSFDKNEKLPEITVDLTKQLNAEIGCTRLVDAKLPPNIQPTQIINNSFWKSIYNEDSVLS